MIEKKRLYPLSCLRGLGGETIMKLVESGIVLVAQLLVENLYELAKKTRLPEKHS